MKQHILRYAILASIVFTSVDIETNTCNSCSDQFVGRSYLFTQPPFHSVSPELISACRHERTIACENCCNGVIQLALLGGQTTDGNTMARYFMPFGEESLIVGEEVSGSPDDPIPNVYAQHIGIKTRQGTFLSRISLQPKQSVVGVGFEWRQSFWSNEETNRGFFIDILFPLLHMKNSVNFLERVIDDGGGVAAPEADNVTFVANATEAFNQPKWMAGKMGKSHGKTGIGDAEIKIGYEWLNHEPFHLETYVGVLLPFGNKQNGEYLFEPVLGFGGSFGMMFGSALGLQVWSDEENDRHLRIEQATHSQYLFSNNQIRSFDVMNKRWSRYMEVYENQNQAEQAAIIDSQYLATPGINVFTKKVEVTPGYSLNTTTAIVYYHKCWHLEAGYNFLAKQAECVELYCDWIENTVAFKHALGAGQTTTTRNITGNLFLTDLNEPPCLAIPVDDYAEGTVSIADLDLNSASSPSLIMNTVYGTIGRRWDHCEYPVFIDFGASYSFAHNSNAVPSHWLAWGKIGISI